MFPDHKIKKEMARIKCECPSVKCVWSGPCEDYIVIYLFFFHTFFFILRFVKSFLMLVFLCNDVCMYMCILMFQPLK